MAHIDLSEDEALALVRILEFYLSDLRMEIADTERVEWRKRMKGEEEFIKRLLNRLQSGTDAA
ncbi:MAG: hypothetical protein FD174_3923 [Geobacteraceae bacterium]|nr:MAG: hypothetical protein FD174_3923 [Geobacteraceae bacterium]